jgi:nitrite reductase/ring-hydroxylating ferredoxin subunit
MRDDNAPLAERVPRRQALRLLAAPALPLLTTACARPPERPRTHQVRVSLAELRPGRRLVVRYRDQPVEVLRSEAGEVQARALNCTHFGCEVAWNEARQSYLCPCHDGRFDAGGQPVAGPPLRPLERLPVAIRGADALVGVP